MSCTRRTKRVLGSLGAYGFILFLAISTGDSLARQNIRDAFFATYPDAVGTAIETVPSQPQHCGVCHYEFTGGGPRNPYGAALEAALPNFPSNPNGRRQAVQSIEGNDPDGDGFSTLIEVTDTSTFVNTPTFPGLTPTNIGSVTSVDAAEIRGHLVPTTGGDTTPPDVVVIYPDGGETIVANAESSIQWIAGDAGGVAGVTLYLSLDAGATYTALAEGLSNSGIYTWFPANRPTTQAIIMIEAVDNSFNVGQDASDSVFTIESPPGGIVPSTLRDFDQPGSQPLEAGILNPPEACAVCHGNYDAGVEPYSNWLGSMMSQASRDVLFMANMVVANQDAPDSGDLCLRCHLPRGWLQGRSVPTDGSRMLPEDESGVSCDFCHRLVDPLYDPLENPPEDEGILADLRFPASDFGNGMATIDPTGARRGPFLDASSGHPVLVSPFHREAALCGTCHDVSNPAFEKDGNGDYVPNAFDSPATDFSSHTLAPVERTYSEWFYSEYNTPGGVYAPQFGGNLDYVATCQDCHMRDVTGEGCNFGSPPTRDDLPLHDMTGGSTWLPGLLGTLFPGEVDELALQAGIARARYMLQNAADLEVVQEDDELVVIVTNNTGHKLPTGYPEGRRMWINVRFYDNDATLISESGGYDPDTGNLSHDHEVKIYDVEPGLDETTASLVGVDPGPSFHFVLNNKIFKDNRIPPRGFTNAAFADFGGAPVAHSYADGQYWDGTSYAIPSGATSAQVTLYYQSTSKEFVEFLRDENTTNTTGQELYDLWDSGGKCPPEVMKTTTVELLECQADEHCHDDSYCNGAETCDLATHTCQAGSPVTCDDGVDCTSDSCNEATDTCDHVPDDGFCDNGLYCDGAETCHAALDCQPGSPVTCDDGVDCTSDSCNEATDTCDHVPDDGFCDNDLYCDGAETCDLADGCQPGSDPCPETTCDEDNDRCTGCLTDLDCDDGLYCNGVETCDEAAHICQSGTSIDCDDGVGCTSDRCDDVIGCVNTPNHDACDDGNICTVDTCDAVAACVNDGTGVTTTCDDNDDCTTDDVCQGDTTGTCAGNINDQDGDTVPDGCDNCPDIPNPSQGDADDDGIGDACDETLSPQPPAAPDLDQWASHVDKNRYVSMVIPNPATATLEETAIRVRLTSLHHPDTPETVPDFSMWEGKYRWVNSLNETHTCPDNITFGTTMRCAVLGCSPEYRPWAEELGGEPLHVTGASVVPSSRYHVAQLAASCLGNEASCSAVSAELLILTSQYGDVAPLVPGETFWEGLSVLDSARIVDHLKGRDYPTVWPPEPGTAMNKPRLHLRPNVPDTLGSYLGVLDVAVCVDAVKGEAYWHFGAFGPCTDCCADEAACPYPNALCCDNPLCCEKDEAEEMPPECNP